MNKNNIIISLFARLTSYVLRYVSSFFFTYLICEMLTIIIMLTTNSGFEKVIVLLLIYTPFQESFGKGTVVLGAKEVVSIFSFWSLVIFIATLVVGKLFPRKLTFNTSLLFFCFFTILHLVAIVRLFNIRGILPVIIVLYIFSLVAWFFYKIINKLAASIAVRFEK